MNPTLEIEELAISIVAPKFNPTLLTPDFLQYSGIVPSDWQLAREPVLNAQMAHVAYTNGVNISVQLNAVTFSENIKAKALESVAVPSLVRKYVRALPNASYQGIGINISAFFTFEGEGEDAPRNYIAKTLLAPGAWQEVGQELKTATVNLAYTLERGQFNLKIDDVQLRLADNSPQAAVLFSGYFPYELVGDSPSSKLENLYEIADNWRGDLEEYRQIIAIFLGRSAGEMFSEPGQ